VAPEVPLLPSQEEKMASKLAKLEGESKALLRDLIAKHASKLDMGKEEFYEVLISTFLSVKSPEVDKWMYSLSVDNQELAFILAMQVDTLCRIGKCLDDGDQVGALSLALELLFPRNLQAAWIAYRNLRGKKGRHRATDWAVLQAEATQIWAEHPGFTKKKVVNLLSEKYTLKPGTVARNIHEPS